MHLITGVRQDVWGNDWYLAGRCIETETNSAFRPNYCK